MNIGYKIYLFSCDFVPVSDPIDGAFHFSSEEWSRLLDSEDDCEDIVYDGSVEEIIAKKRHLKNVEEGELVEQEVIVDGSRVVNCYVETDY